MAVHNGAEGFSQWNPFILVQLNRMNHCAIKHFKHRIRTPSKKSRRIQTRLSGIQDPARLSSSSTIRFYKIQILCCQSYQRKTAQSLSEKKKTTTFRRAVLSFRASHQEEFGTAIHQRVSVTSLAVSLQPLRLLLPTFIVYFIEGSINTWQKDNRRKLAYSQPFTFLRKR